MRIKPPEPRQANSGGGGGGVREREKHRMKKKTFLDLDFYISQGFVIFCLALFRSPEPKVHIVSFWNWIELGSMCLLTIVNINHQDQWANHDQVLDYLKHHMNNGMLSFSPLMFQIA